LQNDIEVKNMGAFEYIVLGGCGLAFAAVTGYAFWVQARVIGLRADLLDMQFYLRRRAAALKGLGDAAFLQADAELSSLQHFADKLSMPMIVYLAGTVTKKLPVTNLPVSEDKLLQEAINLVRSDSVKRIARYIVRSTFGGLIVWLALKAIPNSVAKQEVRDGVAAAITPPPKMNDIPVAVNHC
jgi:hypothetical protein